MEHHITVIFSFSSDVLLNGNALIIQNVPRPLRTPFRRLRIAQVAPLYESVPPKMYGGTERVVAHLTVVGSICFVMHQKFLNRFEISP